jgi:AcrR family transcriptional regulator
VTTTGASPSARRLELLEAAYAYVLEHGLGDVSLRPLAAAIGSSPRVLLYLFGSKDGLVRELLARARADELTLVDRVAEPGELAATGVLVWSWLSAAEHRPLLRLWAEAYTRSLVEPEGAWAGFAAATVHDWLAVLAAHQPEAERDTDAGLVRRTAVLAVLRGGLLDLLATGDEPRVSAAVQATLSRDF